MSSSDSKQIKLGFGSLITTLIAMSGFPISQQHPILYYDVSDYFPNLTSSDVKMFNITLYNFGIVSANNIIVSLYPIHGEFMSLQSIPYLSKNFISNDTRNGFSEIKILPPQSEVLVTGKINTAGINSKIPSAPHVKPHVKVFSDEWSGYSKQEIGLIISVYIVVLYALIGIFMYLWRKYDSIWISERLIQIIKSLRD
jgi:hypothetical protein